MDGPEGPSESLIRHPSPEAWPTGPAHPSCLPEAARAGCDDQQRSGQTSADGEQCGSQRWSGSESWWALVGSFELREFYHGMGPALASPVTSVHTAVLRSWLQLRSLRLLALLKTRSPMVRLPVVITERPAASAAAWRAFRPSLRSAGKATSLVARSNSHWARWRPTMVGSLMVRLARATAMMVGTLVRVRRSERFMILRVVVRAPLGPLV